MATKKIDVPDIGNLLGKISEKRDSGELTKSPIQSVQPVADAADSKESKNSNTQQRQNARVAVPDVGRASGGRPSAKIDSVEYVKISPRIPRQLKRRVDIAIVEERFRDRNGNQIKTLDELVSFALDKLVG